MRLASELQERQEEGAIAAACQLQHLPPERSRDRMPEVCKRLPLKPVSLCPLCFVGTKHLLRTGKTVLVTAGVKVDTGIGQQSNMCQSLLRCSFKYLLPMQSWEFRERQPTQAHTLDTFS